MFTRQHYKAIAEIIAKRFIDLADNAVGTAVKSNVQIIASDLADYLESENPRFDRDKFMTACGLD